MVAEAVQHIAAEGQELQEPCEQKDRGCGGGRGREQGYGSGGRRGSSRRRLLQGSAPKPGCFIRSPP